MRVIFDIEADGLLDEVTKIHCLSYTTDGENITTLTDYEEIRNFFNNPELKLLVGHNIIRYDIPVIEKILGIKISNKVVDTLALSWYLYPQRLKHGLESWGEDFNVPKPKISDWNNLTLQEYCNRCEQDVKINFKLFKDELEYLEEIYGTPSPNIINYLNFKLDCAKEQESLKWRLDINLCKKTLNEFKTLKQEKYNNLLNAMPQVPKYGTKNKPKKLLNKDGKLTLDAQKWFNLLKEHNLPANYNEPVKYVKKYVEPNPDSSAQKKDWLFSLGWEPETYNTVKSKKTGQEKEVPQIYKSDKSVCNSVKKLYEICPELENLDSYSLLSHRIGILEGFLENVDEEGFLKAEIMGFTNTLRFKHTTIVNLPKITKPFSKDIRACLIAPNEEYTLCGSDMSSLEDNTKKHYMWLYDPEFVKEMSKPGYDPHLGIGVFAGIITKEEVDIYKDINRRLENNEAVLEEEKNTLKEIGVKRTLGKLVNFSSLYGAGPAKISKSTGMDFEQAKKLHKAYWDLNWSVKQIGIDLVHKTVRNQMWLYNPVSKFWYSLRVEKDKFSTCNQGTGVYAFDSWVKRVREKGYKICGQFHDEIILPLKIGEEDEVKNNLYKAIEEVNNNLKLNVQLGVSVQFGYRYSEIH